MTQMWNIFFNITLNVICYNNNSCKNWLPSTYLISVDVLRLDLTMRVVIAAHCSVQTQDRPLMLESMSSLCHLPQNFVYIRIHNHDGTWHIAGKRDITTSNEELSTGYSIPFIIVGSIDYYHDDHDDGDQSLKIRLKMRAKRATN